MATLPEQLELLFYARDYTWMIDGVRKHPSATDIEKLLDNCKQALDKPDNDGVQLEVGRLIVRKDGDHLDVYVYFGSLDELETD